MARTNESQDALRDAIRHYSQNLGISQLELADSAKVSQPLISRFVVGATNLSQGSCDRVSKALSRIVGNRVAAVGILLPALTQKISGTLHVEA